MMQRAAVRCGAHKLKPCKELGPGADDWLLANSTCHPSKSLGFICCLSSHNVFLLSQAKSSHVLESGVHVSTTEFLAKRVQACTNPRLEQLILNCPDKLIQCACKDSRISQPEHGRAFTHSIG